MNGKRVAWVLTLVVGATFALACQGDTCAALGTCPEPAPAPNRSVEGHGHGQPQPQRADPQPHESGTVKIVADCQWFNKAWITYTLSLDENPQATKERAYGVSGIYKETHSVAPGTRVTLTCRAMSTVDGSKRMTCLIAYEGGDQLSGQSYQETRDSSVGVRCNGTA